MIYSDSASIKQVQSAINAAGYQPALVVDGVSGPKTTAGVKWFQQQHGLTVDGLIGPQTMAATVAPTPAQAIAAVTSPLAALASQITALQAAPVPAATPTPLVPTPVVAMPTVGLSLPSTPKPATPLAYALPTAASPLSGNIGGVPIPALIGMAAGAAVGAFFGMLWLAVGAVGGGAAGYATTLLPKGATMHGEDDNPEFCTFDADYGCDEPTVVAGEIGVETNVSSLKA
jgi:hypothetical protein